MLAVITEWLEFRSPNFDHLARTLKGQGDFRRPQLVRPCYRARRWSRIFRYRAWRVTKRGATLVTGAAGFIGSFVAQRLLERGDAVIGLDDLNDYYDPELKRARLARLQPSIEVCV